MDIQFISTSDSGINEIDAMAQAIEENERGQMIEICDAQGNSQTVTYNKFLEIFDDYGLEGLALL